MLKLCDANGVLILNSEEQRDRATEILKKCFRNSTTIGEVGLRINEFVKQAREATKELDCGVKTWPSTIHNFTDMITKGIKKEKTKDVYFTVSRLKNICSGSYIFKKNNINTLRCGCDKNDVFQNQVGGIKERCSNILSGFT